MKDFMLIGVNYAFDEDLGLIGRSNNLYLGTVKSNVKVQIKYIDDRDYDYFILETWSSGKRTEEEYYNDELGWHK